MKIIQLCQLYPPAIYGGGEFLFFQYARELVRMGHEVTVIAQRLKGVEDKSVINGVKIIRVGRPINYKGALNTSIIDNLSYITSATREGLKHDFDIIHSNTYAPTISGFLLSHLKHKPHVTSIHDVYSGKDFWKQWSGQQKVSPYFKFIAPLMEKIIIKLPVSTIHTVSNTSKLDIIKAGAKSPIRVIPCVININDYKPCHHRVKNQFCFIGRHVFYKNVDTIIKAMKLINAKFIVIGDGPMRSEWESLAKRLGVSDRVVFTGRVSDELKNKIICESKFCVLPSTVEGFGIVILESWALNKPMIVSDLPPMNELVTNPDLRAKPFKPSDWASKINKLLSKRRSNYRHLAERFDVKRVTKELAELFKTLIVNH